MGIKGLRFATPCLTALAVLAAPAGAGAQGIFGSRPSPPPAPDTAAALVQAIPFSEIPFRADDAVARLRAVEKQLSVDPDIMLVETALPDELAAISQAHGRLSRIVLEQLSVRELWILTNIWRSYQDRLSGWAATYDDELRELGESAEVGAGIRDSWRLTADRLRADESAPESLREQADRVLDTAAGLERGIRQRLEYLLGVKSQIDDGLDGVDHVVAELVAARASVRGRILARNSVPIWRMRTLRESSSSQVAARSWGDWREGAARFVAENSGRLLFNVLLFFLFALLAVRLRNVISAGLDPEDSSLAAAADTLSRPFSAAALVALLTANLLYQRAPAAFWEALSLVAVVPLYRLLPRSRIPAINRTVRAIVILFAVVSVGRFLIPPSVEYRVFNLAVAIALTGVAGWLLRDVDPDRMREGGWGVVVWRGLQLSLAIGVTTVVANVLGWTLLAEILIGAVLFSAFLGLGLVIAYRVIAGVVRVLPRTRIASASLIMKSHGDLITGRAISLLRIVALVSWAYMTLQAFEALDLVSQWLAGALTGHLKLGAFTFSLDRILYFGAVLLLAIWIARFVRFVLEVEVLPRLKLPRGVANAIATVAQWTLLGAGIMAAASALGLEASQLAIIFGALGVGIGFGLQNIVSNFVSGLILIFEQPVKVGDKVEITSLSLTGEVRRIGIRASVVRTFDGAEVVVPNANLISSEVVNWTLSDQRRRIRIEVGVAYGTDPHRVIEILKGVAAAHPDVVRYPEPEAIFLGFGDSSLDFRLLTWTGNFDEFLRLRSALSLAAYDALEDAGIEIPFPQRDVHVRSLPAPAEAAVDLADLEDTRPD